MKDMTRAKRRHARKTRKAAVVRWYKANPHYTTPENKYLCQMVDTTIWVNFETKFGRPKKLSDRKADVNMAEQLKEVA